VTSIDTGFQTGNLLVANLGLRESRYNSAAARAFYDDLLERVRAIPGVHALAYTDASPLRRARVAEISVSTSPDGTQQQTRTDHIAVGADYFRTVGALVLQGRPLGPEDHAGGQQVAVVNETFAKERFPWGAVGQTLYRGQRGPQPLIVGVIRDLPQGSPSADAAHNAVVFRPLAQTEGRNFLELMVRTTGEPEQLEGAISGAVRAIDPTQPPPTFTTVERQLSESVAPRRFVLVLLTLFAALAGSLAVLGLYAVLAYLVAERTREIGVRLALGADAARVTRMVLRQGAALVAIGTVLGVAGSLVAVRVLKAVMYETSVYDAPTFAAVAGLLCAVGLLASWIPARRASRVDPVIALRAD
jgi:predicted permease